MAAGRFDEFVRNFAKPGILQEWVIRVRESLAIASAESLASTEINLALPDRGCAGCADVPSRSHSPRTSALHFALQSDGDLRRHPIAKCTICGPRRNDRTRARQRQTSYGVSSRMPRPQPRKFDRCCRCPVHGPRPKQCAGCGHASATFSTARQGGYRDGRLHARHSSRIRHDLRPYRHRPRSSCGMPIRQTRPSPIPTRSSHSLWKQCQMQRQEAMRPASRSSGWPWI